MDIPDTGALRYVHRLALPNGAGAITFDIAVDLGQASTDDRRFVADLMESIAARYRQTTDVPADDAPSGEGRG